MVRHEGWQVIFIPEPVPGAPDWARPLAHGDGAVLDKAANSVQGGLITTHRHHASLPHSA
jgi:hypothetical protein